MQTQAPPAWLADVEDSAPLQQSQRGGAPLLGGGGGGGGSGASKDLVSVPPLVGRLCTPVVVRHSLKAITMALCVLMFVTACIGIQTINGVNTAGKIFIAIYMLFFSVLLFLFEAIQIHKVEWLDHVYQRNFGFLYGVVGKAFFVIFIAFLSFGLGDPESLSMATGLSLACFGAAKVALFLKYPELFEDERQTEINKGSEIMSAAL